MSLSRCEQIGVARQLQWVTVIDGRQRVGTYSSSGNSGGQANKIKGAEWLNRVNHFYRFLGLWLMPGACSLVIVDYSSSGQLLERRGLVSRYLLNDLPDTSGV